jgi:hypothetical protein
VYADFGPEEPGLQKLMLLWRLLAVLLQSILVSVTSISSGYSYKQALQAGNS